MIRGVFASHSAQVGDRAVDDLAGRVLLNGFGGMVPMLALSAGVPKDSISNTNFTWVEDYHISGSALATATATNVATTITVDDPNIWIPGSIISNLTTGEYMYVTAIAGNVVTVIRGFQGTVATAVAVGNVFQIISTAFAEATRGAAAVADTGESRTSYVQIFKRSYEVSGTAQSVKYSSGDKLAQNKQQAMGWFHEDLERAACFGRPSVSTIATPDGAKEIRTTAGLRYSIQTFGGKVVYPAENGVTGRINLRTLNSFIADIFDRQIKGQPNERITFCGSKILHLIHDMVLDLKGYRYHVDESKFGMRITELVTPTGSLKLMTHPLFVENPIWNEELWAWHPGGVRRKELRPIQVIPQGMGSREDGLDATKGHILMEMGFEFRGNLANGMISGAKTAGGLASLPTS